MGDLLANQTDICPRTYNGIEREGWISSVPKNRPILN